MTKLALEGGVEIELLVNRYLMKDDHKIISTKPSSKYNNKYSPIACRLCDDL